MKKLFTLIALLACFMGVKAEWVEDFKIDYSTKSGFPFYVMGYVPEWVDGVMTDYGAMYKYVTLDNEAGETSDVTVKTDAGVEYYRIALESPGWHQYFLADGIPTELDGAYTVKAMVKASEEVTINVNMGWGWGEGQSTGAQVKIGTEWAEVEWEYTGIGGTSCNLVAQPGTASATIEWKWLTVSHNAKAQRPTVWQEWITNDGKSIIPDVPTESKYVGDAEFGEWPAWALEKTPEGINANWRGDRANEICAWALTMGRNFDDQAGAISTDSPRARPFPADIEADPADANNHVFAVHVTQVAVIDAPEPDANSIQWSNQFWIESPQGWKEGTQVKIHFRYKADKAAKVATQIHKKNPSIYLHWNAVGDINFTEEWQDFDKTITFDGSQAGGYSLAFNLTSSFQEPNTYYFDDLSWQTMKLDEGLFIASSNAAKGIEYDFDNATELVYDEAAQAYVATVGTAGKEDTWVNEVMISTTRGNDAAFKGATLKPTKAVVGGEDDWIDYAPGSLAKIKLPAAGVWTVSVDTENKQMNFIKVEGEENKEPLDIKPNESVVVVHGLERAEKKSGDDDTDPTHTGADWDNQFFIKANRALAAGEETVVEFDYVGSIAAKTGTQCHGETPGAYMHWSCIGDVDFTTEEQHFSKEFTIPSEADGMWCIAFNMAIVKEACDYTIKNIVWKLKDNSETLINQTGVENFYVKEGAGTNPRVFGTDPSGISSVVNNGTVSNGATYNLAGQRVSGDYKGIVVKNGKKYLAK